MIENLFNSIFITRKINVVNQQNEEKKHVFCLVTCTCGQKKGPIQTFRNASTDNPCLCSKVKIRIKKVKKNKPRTARRRPLRPIVQFLF